MLPMRPRRLPGAELRERRVPRGDGALVSRGRPAALAAAPPRGPIVLVQVDNEGALYFRDGEYDQDYHPDSLPRSGVPPREVPAPARAAATPGRTTRCVRHRGAAPPLRREGGRRPRAPRRLDRVPRAAALDGDGAHGRRARPTRASTACRRRTTCRSARPRRRSTRRAWRRSTCSASTTTTAPSPPSTGPSCAGRPSWRCAARDAAARPTARRSARGSRRSSPRSTSSTRCTRSPARWPMASAASTSTWRWSATGGSARPSIRTARASLRGGVPASARGARRGKLHTLRRRAPVRLVVPRALRRLARATHAFGPLTPALFNVIGVGLARERAGARLRPRRAARHRGRGVPPRVRAGAPRARRPVRVRRRRDGRALDRGRAVDRLRDGRGAQAARRGQLARGARGGCGRHDGPARARARRRDAPARDGPSNVTGFEIEPLEESRGRTRSSPAASTSWACPRGRSTRRTCT